MAAALGIHLIGAGIGESIVIELPNGRIGVIDCYCSRLSASTSEERLDANPTLRFLDDHLHAESLAFIALTHPHEDHGRGLSQILEHYQNRIEQIWIFETYQDECLCRYFRTLLESKRRLPVEELLNDKPGSFSTELMKTRNLVREETTTGTSKTKLRKFQDYQEFGLADEPVEFHFLGPSSQLVDRYQTSLSDSLSSLVDPETKNVYAKWRPDKVNHNLASPAILLVYGKTRVILGGDMESTGWQQVLVEQQDETVTRPPLDCTFVKVSHHGSSNGYCDGLYAMLSERKAPVAAITPFNRGALSLPSTEGLNHLKTNTSEVFVTNLTRVKGPYAPKTLGDFVYLSPSWASLLRRHPEWTGALEPSVVETEAEFEPLHELPTALVYHLRSDPELALALRPQLADQVHLPSDDQSAERTYRLSFFFDANGHELKKRRYVGPGAGKIA